MLLGGSGGATTTGAGFFSSGSKRRSTAPPALATTSRGALETPPKKLAESAALPGSRYTVQRVADSPGMLRVPIARTHGEAQLTLTLCRSGWYFSMVSRARRAVPSSLAYRSIASAASVEARDPCPASTRARMAWRRALALATAASAASKCEAAPS